MLNILTKIRREMDDNNEKHNKEKMWETPNKS